MNKLNSKLPNGQPMPLNSEERQALKNKDFRINDACQKSWKDLIHMDVRGDFYIVIDKKLGNKDEKGLSVLVASFLFNDLTAIGAEGNYFRQVYRFLSDLAHANPFAITSMFSIEKTSNDGMEIVFHNGDPQILLYALNTVINCYCYVSEILLRCFKKDNEVLKLANIMTKYQTMLKAI